MMAREILHVMKLTPEAIVPVRGSTLAAGLDLASAYDCVIPSGGKGLVKTDLAIALPEGCYARVAPRSGLAYKKFIDTGAGVIDADYRGNVGVILFNHSKEDFEIKRGDRVAQLILEKIAYPDVAEVSELPDTERGSGGFGSTGTAGMGNDTAASKRPRTVHEDPMAPEETRMIFSALDMIHRESHLSSDDCQLLRKQILNAPDRQYNVLCQVLRRYMEKEQDAGELMAWVRALQQDS